MKEAVFYAVVFVFLILAISSVITSFIARTYYTFTYTLPFTSRTPPPITLSVAYGPEG